MSQHCSDNLMAYSEIHNNINCLRHITQNENSRMSSCIGICLFWLEQESYVLTDYRLCVTEKATSAD
jgi:hypothetical protein